MSPQRKRAAPGNTENIENDQEIRGQEVLRANKELAAYFKGRRTEREARAALKIIKAFIRDRERVDPGNRRPLPGAEQPKAPRPAAKAATASAAKKRRPTRVRRPQDTAAPSREPPSPSTEDASARDVQD